MAQVDYNNMAQAVLRMMQERDKRLINFNLALSRETEAIKDLKFGRLAMSIPEDHFRVLTLLDPELNSQDNHTRFQAEKRLMNSEISIPYRINSKQRKL